MPTEKQDKAYLFPSIIPRKGRGTLTPKQKAAERNYEIASKFQTGVKVPELMKEYKLSQPQVYRIVKEHADAAEKWSASLPTATATALHEIISRKAFRLIEEMEVIVHMAEKKQEYEFAFKCKLELFKCHLKYTDFINNTITARETLKIVKEAKRVIDISRNKQ